MGLCLNIASFFYIDKQLENINDIKFIIKIISIKEEKDYTNKYVAQVLEAGSRYNIKNVKIIIYTEKDKNFLPGDIVYIKGTFSKADSKRNYGGFDYNKYLKQAKIFGIVQTEDCKKVSESKDLNSFFENFRYKLLKKIDNLFNKEDSEFLKSLLFGKMDGLSDEIKESFRDSSLSHVLAISGMHVTYVIIGLKTIIDRIVKSKKFKNNLLIFFIIIFSFITGNSVSGIRACIMGCMIFLASNFERKNNFYFSFIYSFFIIIIFNPYNIYNVGLWLSYMGTLGIVCFSSFFKRYIFKKFNLKNKKETLILKFEKYILENLIVTFFAQILIFPIMMYVFNIISLSFFISNILISFLVGPILILGYASVILSLVNFPFIKTIVFLEDILVCIIIEISRFCARLPLSKIYVTTPNFFGVLLYYAIIVAIIYVFNRKRFYFIKLCFSYKFFEKEIFKFKDFILLNITKMFENKCLKKNKSWKNKCNLVKKYILILFIVITVIFSQIVLKKKSVFQINFVDVGQGDCTYIKTPSGKNIIIDGGEGNSGKYDYGENVVLPYLLDKGVKKIDYLIVSHADSDHIGGLFAVLKNIKVDKILICIQPEISEQYLDLLNVSTNKKVELIELKSGDKIKIEKDILLDVLWPKESDFIEDNALNNNSLVFKLYYRNFSVLFTGDIEEIAENRILELYKNNLEILDSTILKVAHHGSKTSTLQAFIENVKPKIALIGVGKNNKFGHPSESVLKVLEKNNVMVYRTDKNGEISIYVNDEKIKINSIINNN